MHIEQEIEAIKLRNQKVEADKTWERSWLRRLFIMFVTYAVASIWLVTIKDSTPFLKALVPVAGYLLSTLSLPPLKKVWVKRNFK